MPSEFDKNRYGTPWPFYLRLNDEFDFTLDAAADSLNHKHHRYLTKQDDTLSKHDLKNERIWLNPPYSDGEMYNWLEWAFETAQYGNNIVVCLLPANTDTKWWHDFVMCASEIRFVKGRVSFLKDGQPTGSPRHLSAVVVFRPGLTGPSISSMLAEVKCI